MSKRRKTTEELATELEVFHHDEAAARLRHLDKLMAGRCQHCGRTDWREDEMSDNPEVLTGVDNRTKRRGTLTITIGLPGSGKSTWGELMRQKHPDRVRIVNRDDIRAANGTRFEDGDEPYVAQIRDTMVDRLLVHGYDVICTDTNLSPKVRRRLAQIAKTRKAEVIETSFLHVPLDVCLARNNDRWANGDRKVPNSAIIGMYNEFVAQPSNWYIKQDDPAETKGCNLTLTD